MLLWLKICCHLVIELSFSPLPGAAPHGDRALASMLVVVGGVGATRSLPYLHNWFALPRFNKNKRRRRLAFKRGKPLAAKTGSPKVVMPQIGLFVS